MKKLVRKIKQLSVDITNKNIDNVSMEILSMGMTGDYIKTQGDRPLLQCENPELVFINLLDKRDKNYRKADYIIDTTLLSPEQVAREVLRRGNETFVIS